LIDKRIMQVRAGMLQIQAANLAVELATKGRGESTAGLIKSLGRVALAQPDTPLGRIAHYYSHSLGQGLEGVSRWGQYDRSPLISRALHANLALKALDLDESLRGIPSAIDTGVERNHSVRGLMHEVGLARTPQASIERWHPGHVSQVDRRLRVPTLEQYREQLYSSDLFRVGMPRCRWNYLTETLSHISRNAFAYDVFAREALNDLFETPDGDAEIVALNDAQRRFLAHKDFFDAVALPRPNADLLSGPPVSRKGFLQRLLDEFMYGIPSAIDTGVEREQGIGDLMFEASLAHPPRTGVKYGAPENQFEVPTLELYCEQLRSSDLFRVGIPRHQWSAFTKALHAISQDAIDSGFFESEDLDALFETPDGDAEIVALNDAQRRFLARKDFFDAVVAECRRKKVLQRPLQKSTIDSEYARWFGFLGFLELGIHQMFSSHPFYIPDLYSFATIPATDGLSSSAPCNNFHCHFDNGATEYLAPFQAQADEIRANKPFDELPYTLPDPYLEAAAPRSFGKMYRKNKKSYAYLARERPQLVRALLTYFGLNLTPSLLLDDQVLIQGAITRLLYEAYWRMAEVADNSLNG
jgi:hypothetical protein